MQRPPLRSPPGARNRQAEAYLGPQEPPLACSHSRLGIARQPSLTQFLSVGAKLLPEWVVEGCLFERSFEDRELLIVQRLRQGGAHGARSALRSISQRSPKVALQSRHPEPYRRRRPGLVTRASPPGRLDQCRNRLPRRDM